MIILIFLLSGYFATVNANNSIDSLENMLSTTDESEQAAILNELSNRLWLTNVEKSIEYAEKAQRLSEKYNQPVETYNALYNLAAAYSRMDTLNLTIKYCKEVLNIASQIGDSMLIARANFELGTNLSEKGQYENALKYLLQSLQIVEKKYDDGDSLNTIHPLAFIANNVGILYNRIGNKEKALQYYQLSLSIKTRLGDSAGIANMLNNIGLIYAENSAFKKADEYYSKSIAILRKLNDSTSLAETIFNKWELAIKRKQFQKALAFYDSVKMFKPYFNGRTLTMMFANIADLFLKLNKPQKAYPNIKKSLEMAKETNMLDLVTKSYRLFSEYYAQLSDYRQAYNYQQKFVKLNDSLINTALTSRLAEMQTRYETEKKEKQIAILKKDKQLKEAELEKQKSVKFIFLASFILVIIIAVLLISRMKAKQRHKQAELERRNLENEQKLLRSQMNPHFIFNSLNSIQGFISSNDSFKAMGFLSKFGHLIRRILENSRESFITLENEMETLRLYIEMEKLRYKDVFDYELLVDDSLDVENTFIPPLIIQPFVENAIVHGLSPKKKNGKLKIEFFKDDSRLIVKVVDNGIGRKISLTKASSPDNAYKSLGIKLTQERLTILGIKTKVATSFTINDLKDKNNLPAGTEVVISIPQEYNLRLTN